MTRELATPDPDSRPDEKEPEARRQPMVEAWISQQVFALYDGKRMTKEDSHNARMLAAQWQAILEEKVTREQLVVCTRGLVTMLDAILKAVGGGCKECGK